MKLGTYIIGVYKGYQSKPWSNGTNAGVNHTIKLQTGEYDDGFGEVIPSFQKVEVHEQAALKFQARGNELHGKLISIPVIYRSKKGGRDGHWLSCFMPQESEIQVLSPGESGQKKAS
jgi:hypothetical protein